MQNGDVEQLVLFDQTVEKHRATLSRVIDLASRGAKHLRSVSNKLERLSVRASKLNHTVHAKTHKARDAVQSFLARSSPGALPATTTPRRRPRPKRKLKLIRSGARRGREKRASPSRRVGQRAVSPGSDTLIRQVRRACEAFAALGPDIEDVVREWEEYAKEKDAEYRVVAMESVRELQTVRKFLRQGEAENTALQREVDELVVQANRHFAERQTLLGTVQRLSAAAGKEEEVDERSAVVVVQEDSDQSAFLASIQALRDRIVAQDRTIVELKEGLSRRDDMLADRESRVELLAAQLKEVQAQLKEARRANAQVSEPVWGSEELVDNSELRREIEFLHEELERQGAENQRLRGELEDERVARAESQQTARSAVQANQVLQEKMRLTLGEYQQLLLHSTRG